MQSTELGPSEDELRFMAERTLQDLGYTVERKSRANWIASRTEADGSPVKYDVCVRAVPRQPKQPARQTDFHLSKYEHAPYVASASDNGIESWLVAWFREDPDSRQLEIQVTFGVRSQLAVINGQRYRTIVQDRRLAEMRPSDYIHRRAFPYAAASDSTSLGSASAASPLSSEGDFSTCASSPPLAELDPPAAREAIVLPPFDGAGDYLNRIRKSRGLPERNMEDLVKDLLVRLGHSAALVVFQIGRIDVLVQDSEGKPSMVIEVKTNLQSKKDRDNALRQGFDYAQRNGAPIVVITDADSYEIYDRRKGLDYASALQASFRLTSFRPSDATSLHFLRPCPDL